MAHTLTDDVIRQLTEGLTSAIDSLDNNDSDQSQASMVDTAVGTAERLRKLRDLLPDFDHPTAPADRTWSDDAMPGERGGVA